MFISKAIVVVVVSVAASSVLATPHALNHAFHHRAIAARVASPPPPPNNATFAPLRRRQNNQRCKKRPKTSSSSVNYTKPSPSPPPPTHPQPTPTTTPQQAAPPVTSSKPPPSPSPSPSPSPTPKSTQAPTTGGSNQPSYMSGPQTGQGTFYSTGLGACGITNNDNDHIAAVSHLMFDTYPGYDGINPNRNPICGKKVKATYDGKSVVVTITDRCTGCATTDLDFSPAAYDELALAAVGRISGMVWFWV